jgi:outer membrane immunogenic protein
MHWLKYGAGVATALALGGSAMAADLPVKARPAPPPVPYVSWTGCYFGGQAGGVWTNSDVTFTDLHTGLGTENLGFNNNSWIAGGNIGCQYQFTGNWLLGIEGTWSATDLGRTDTSVFNPAATRHLGVDQIATVEGKLGYAWDRVLFYGVGGYAAARVNLSVDDPTIPATFNATDWRSGVTAGLGIDYMPWQNIVLGIRGDWYQFDADRNGLDSAGLVDNFSGHVDAWAVTGRIDFLFNWWQPPAVSARY